MNNQKEEKQMLWGERKWRVEAASVWLFCLGFVPGRQPPATDPHGLSHRTVCMVCLNIFAHMWMPEVSVVCLKCSPQCGLRQDLSPNLQLTDSARPVRHRDPLSSASIALGRQTCAAVPRSSIGAWSSPSGPHACSASTLQPEPSPQPTYWLLYFGKQESLFLLILIAMLFYSCEIKYLFVHHFGASEFQIGIS